MQYVVCYVLIFIQYALDLFDCLKADYEHKSATGLYINVLSKIGKSNVKNEKIQVLFSSWCHFISFCINSCHLAFETFLDRIK